MHIFISYFAVFVSLVQIRGLAYAAPLVTPRYLQKIPVSRRDLSSEAVRLELGPLLSDVSTIFSPDSPEWANATERYNNFSRPDVQVVVLPGDEDDVSKIVKYCNDNSIGFMAYTTGHGLSPGIQRFKGLQINMENLNSIVVAEDKKSALLQGGLNNAQVSGSLWEQGYVTTHGTAACVGLVGAGLGGGHGVYEGQYGLALDNFLHLNVVLADGTAVGVNATSHEDLFWAMRGAGHNFGIVTSVQMKVFPRKIDTWYFHNYWWAGAQLEEAFEALNEFHVSYNGTTPPLMGFNAGSFAINASVSETEAVISWGFSYAGPEEEAEKLLAPFNAIRNLGETRGVASFPNISDAMANGGEAAVCSPNSYWAGTSTVIGHYNVTAQRRIFDLLNHKVAQYPELAATSRVYNEGYATKGMEDVPSDSTAYPHRDKKHVIFFLSGLEEGSPLQAAAELWAKEIWELWLEGEGPGARPGTYVNYGLGGDWETRESFYGYEEWRLERLVQLKAKYDPHNRFGYFNPIIE